jgi:hypothetical protein
MNKKESRLTVDREYRKQRWADFCVKKTNEEKQTHLVSRIQYEVKHLADQGAQENAKERKERLTILRVRVLDLPMR